MDLAAETADTQPPAGVAFESVGVALGDAVLLLDASGVVAPGEILAITGENGSGKTTLLRVIAGLQRPTAGTVTVHGKPPDERNPAFRRAVAAHLGPPATARDLTVGEHLRFLAATWGEDPDAAAGAHEELLADLSISALTSRFPHELSSGQTQLFHLALVLARPSSVLLLDEPEQRLDPHRLEAVAGILRRRAEAGTAIVLATHSPALREQLAARTLRIDPA